MGKRKYMTNLPDIKFIHAIQIYAYEKSNAHYSYPVRLQLSHEYISQNQHSSIVGTRYGN